jgi:hypothetical protein
MTGKESILQIANKKYNGTIEVDIVEIRGICPSGRRRLKDVFTLKLSSPALIAR